MDLTPLEKALTNRIFTLGRKQKSGMMKTHDVEVEGDVTVSSHQCYFAYVPESKCWYVQDGHTVPDDSGCK